MTTQKTSPWMGSGGPDEVRTGAVLAEAAVEGVPAPRVSAEDLVDGPWLEAMLASVDKTGLRLTGEGGFLPALIKAVLERGLAVAWNKTRCACW